MSATIISPEIPKEISNDPLTLQFFNKTAEILYKVCKDECVRSGRIEPIFLGGLDATKRILRDRVDEDLNNNVSDKRKMFVYYGSLVDGVLSGSDGQPLLDLNDVVIKNYLRNKILYVIATNGETLEQIGSQFTDLGIRGFIGTYGKFLHLDGIDSKLEEFTYHTINSHAKMICHNGTTDVAKAVKDARSYIAIEVKKIGKNPTFGDKEYVQASVFYMHVLAGIGRNWRKTRYTLSKNSDFAKTIHINPSEAKNRVRSLILVLSNLGMHNLLIYPVIPSSRFPFQN